MAIPSISKLYKLGYSNIIETVSKKFKVFV